MHREINQGTPEDHAIVFHEYLEESKSELEQLNLETPLVDKINTYFSKIRIHYDNQEKYKLDKTLYNLEDEVERWPITDSQKGCIKRIITRLKATNVEPYYL
jgi:hypothetical protein